MTLKEQIPDDAALFLNEDEMAESVTYEDSAILAVVDQGVQTREGIDGNEISTDGTSTRAMIFVSPEDVASPARDDSITDESGTVWTVMSIQSTDAGMHALLCVAHENPWG